MTSVLSAVSIAGTPAPSPSPPPPPPPPAPPPPPSDESFIEFLGADDVGDAGWWDFLKKTDPQTATATPPPGPKQ
jgi:hypothetical protein